MTAEKVIRLLLKALQLALSFLIVYCLLCVGPQWIMILACLIVPFFGVFLILKTPNKRCYVSKNTQQLITATESKNWTKVDFTLCFTMTIVFLGLSIIMFYGFFALLSRNVYLLIAGTASLVASMLYLFNALICLTQIRSLSRTINLASFASQRSKSPINLSATNLRDGNMGFAKSLNKNVKAVARLRCPPSSANIYNSKSILHQHKNNKKEVQENEHANHNLTKNSIEKKFSAQKRISIPEKFSKMRDIPQFNKKFTSTKETVKEGAKNLTEENHIEKKDLQKESRALITNKEIRNVSNSKCNTKLSTKEKSGQSPIYYSRHVFHQEKVNGKIQNQMEEKVEIKDHRS